MRFRFTAAVLFASSTFASQASAVEPTMVEMFKAFCLDTQADRAAVASLAETLPDDWKPVKVHVLGAKSPYLTNDMWAKVYDEPGAAEPPPAGGIPFGLSSSIPITADADGCGVAGSISSDFSLSDLKIPGLIVSDRPTVGGGTVGGPFESEGERFFLLKTVQPTFTSLNLWHQTGCPDEAVIAGGEWGSYFTC